MIFHRGASTMKTYITRKVNIFVVIFLIARVSQITAGGTRHRRHILQLGELIECETGRDPLDYVGYGCWCGIGGSGQPLDDVDRCCFEHDRCYDVLFDTGVCEDASTYFQWYAYRNDEEQCPPREDVQCGPGQDDCALGKCECDLAISRCLGRAKYNHRYQSYSRYIRCSTWKYFCGWFGC